jgi:hypothetical protein
MVAQVGCSKGLTYVAGDGHGMANNQGIAFCQTLESPEPVACVVPRPFNIGMMSTVFMDTSPTMLHLYEAVVSNPWPVLDRLWCA